MSKLAIKGHPTRGKEVIELLEMLGGVDWHGFAGNRLDSAYYISESRAISFDDTYDIVFEDGIKEFITFTLEEFLGKYPYKVDDRIRYNTKNGNIGDIISMVWDESINDIIYTVAFSHGYKELTVDKIIPIKPKYPKTYEECCDVMYKGVTNTYGNCIIKINDGYKGSLIQSFQRLIFYRDAYWKIAGEKMGLGKPWKPNYDSGVNKYGIICMNGVVQKSNPTTNWERHLNKVLDFPTEEMRDAFYDNFNDLIEECKELL